MEQNRSVLPLLLGEDVRRKVLDGRVRAILLRQFRKERPTCENAPTSNRLLKFSLPLTAVLPDRTFATVSGSGRDRKLKVTNTNEKQQPINTILYFRNECCRLVRNLTTLCVSRRNTFILYLDFIAENIK